MSANSSGPLPIGTILAYTGTNDPDPSSTFPDVWLICDGRQVGRQEYPQLNDTIGDWFGDGDGKSTFNLPDFRGVFLRGADNAGTSQGAANRDPDASSRTNLYNGGNTGDKIGSYQADAFASHTHANNAVYLDWQERGNALLSGYSGSSAPNNFQTSWASYGTGGNETRPKNVYVNFIIKAQ